MENDSIIEFKEPSDLLEIIKDPGKITAAIAGILASKKADLVLSTGRIIQAGLKFKMLKQVGEEIHNYAKKGVIKENFLETDINQVSFYELLKFIDEEAPDKERLVAMKSIFFSSIEVKAQIDGQLAYELMQTCKELSSGEILVLKAMTSLYEKKHNLSGALRDSWFREVANELGHKMPSLVAKYEDHLLSLKLIGEITHSDRSGIRVTEYGRLTELGFSLCQFITKFK